jgi:cytochrome c oxidase assembly protein subunit 15
MVASGLSVRTDVSQYRLAMHVTLACIILAAIIWVSRGLTPARGRDRLPLADRWLAYGFVPLVLVQIFLGGLVAGLDAGRSYNSWPLMDGHFFPPLADLHVMTPVWLNHFENALTVQFQHRMVAYLLIGLALWHAFSLRSKRPGSPAARRATGIAAIALAQGLVGVMTLLLVVPLWAGLLHQAWAIILLAMVTVHAHAVAREARRPVATPPPVELPAGAAA